MEITSTVLLDSTSQVSSIKATKQFNINNEKLEASGKISCDGNTVQYTITTAKEEIQEIKNDTIPLSNANNNDKTTTSDNKLVNIEMSEDAFDSSPQTSDTFNVGIVIAMIISISLMILSIYSLTRKNHIK